MNNPLNIFLTFLSLLMFSFTDGNKKKNGLEYDHLRGHVKSVHEYDYPRPMMDKNNIDPLKIPLDDTAKHASFNYDKNGNLLEHINNVGIPIENYTYDNSMKRIQSVTNYAPDYIIQDGTYTYDDKDNLIEHKVRTIFKDTSYSKIIYKYDDNGNLIETDSYNRNKFLYKWIYKVDDKGNQVELSKYNETNTLVEMWTYAYDSRGNNIELALYQDSLKQKYVYSYNDYNDKIEEVLYGRYSILLHDYKYEYTYDKNENWIKRVEKDNNIWKDITLRVIEYY